MIILLLLRRMSPRARKVTGWALLGVGAAVAVVSAALSVDLYVHAVILAACGAVFVWTPVRRRGPRRAAGRKAAAREASRAA